MSTYQTHFLSEIRSGEPIPEGKLAYLRERTKNRIYNYILKRFLQKESEEGFTRAELARRIGRRPEVITRILGAPGNWTLDTVSDLLVGICAEELEPCSAPLLDRSPRNYMGPDWITLTVGTPVKPVVTGSTSAQMTLCQPN